MARFNRLIQYFGTLVIHKGVFTNRILSPSYQQIATIKTPAKTKLLSLKLPEPPKRPLTPYMRFLIDNREKVKKEHPEYKMPEVLKQCALEWKELDGDLKQTLAEKYNKEVEDYSQKQFVFNESLTVEQLNALKEARIEKRHIRIRRAIRKAEREADKPKRPVISFIHYMTEKRLLSENKGKKYAELLCKYKDEWKTMPDDKKKQYNVLFENDKIRYAREMELWEAKMVKTGNDNLIRKSSKVLTTQPGRVPKAKLT